MDPLKDWYEYLDRVSRPVRRQPGAEPDAPPPWRPWAAGQEEPAEIDGALDPEQVPQLFPSLGGEGAANTAVHASRAFEDPTLHDELEPIPDYEVPDFSAPTFDVEKPSFMRKAEAASAAPDAPVPEADLEPGAEAGEPVEEDAVRHPAETGAKGGEIVGHTAPFTGSDPAARAREYRALLARAASSMPEGEADSRGQAPREELLAKLSDPVLTLEEAALILGVCPTTVRRYTNSGRLPHQRTTGNQRRFRLSEVLQFLENRGPDGEIS